MPKANVRLQIRFDFDLEVPAALATADHAQLCKTLAGALGVAVNQGMPTVSAKQLEKLGIRLVAHHHHLDATNLSAPAVPREAVLAVAPHLTEDEADQVARTAASRMPATAPEQERHLRRAALALVNEYRLVPCQVCAALPNGTPVILQGALNLTNGHVVIGEQHRQTRLRAGSKALPLKIDGTALELAAECSGHTLTGPVLDVAVASLSPHRETLMAAWRRQT